MEIFIPVKMPLVRGFVQAEIFYKEDILQMEPKHYQECDNTIDDDLLEAIMAHIIASGSPNTDWHLDDDTWCQYKYPGNMTDDTNQGSTLNNGKDGIYCLTDDITGYVNKVNQSAGNNNIVRDFCLTDNTSHTAGDNAKEARWSAQAEWGTGTSGDISLGDDTTVSQFFIGRNEGIDGTTNGQLNRFTFKYASASPSSFTLETDDVLKLTWTIAVGPE